MNYLLWKHAFNNMWSAKTESHIYQIQFSHYNGYKAYIININNVHEYQYIGSYDTLEEAKKKCEESKNNA